MSNPRSPNSYKLQLGIREVIVQNRDILNPTHCFCFNRKHPKGGNYYSWEKERRWNGDLKTERLPTSSRIILGISKSCTLITEVYLRSGHYSLTSFCVLFLKYFLHIGLSSEDGGSHPLGTGTVEDVFSAEPMVDCRARKGQQKTDSWQSSSRNRHPAAACQSPTSGDLLSPVIVNLFPFLENQTTPPRVTTDCDQWWQECCMLSKILTTRVHAVAFTIFFFLITYFLSLRRVKCDLIFIKKGNINF